MRTVEKTQFLLAQELRFTKYHLNECVFNLKDS